MKVLCTGLLVLCVTTFFIISCISDPGDPPETREINLDKALLDLPSAVNAPQSGSDPGQGSRSIIVHTAEDTALAVIGTIYNPVRDVYNPLASEIIRFTNQLIAEMDTSLFSNDQVIDTLKSDGVVELTFDDQSQKARMTLDNATYTVESWKKIQNAWLKILDIRFSKNSGRYVGTIHARDEQLDAVHRPEFRIDFDTSDPEVGQVMELRVINLDYDDPAVTEEWESFNIPHKLWLKATQDDNSFYIAANVFYRNIYLNGDQFTPYLMSVLNDNEPYIPGVTRVDANYIYRGAVNVGLNVGAVDLALVPEDTEDTGTIFSLYSMATIYKEAVAAWVKDNATIIEGLNFILDEVGAGFQISADSGVDEIFSALTLAGQYFEEQGYSDETIDAVLFVVQLTNPGYFDSVSGFVGNDSIRRPLWADAVPAYEFLKVRSAAEISSDTFTVVMPDDVGPDF